MYMALGAGLPVIVTPMAAGGVIVDNEDGFVIDAHDEEKWVEKMRMMVEVPELRVKLSMKSKSKAKEFTWDVVANKRLSSLIQAENQLK
jgi:glycosyltransferase involved in cell wall biosynthesis